MIDIKVPLLINHVPFKLRGKIFLFSHWFNLSWTSHFLRIDKSLLFSLFLLKHNLSCKNFFFFLYMHKHKHIKHYMKHHYSRYESSHFCTVLWVLILHSWLKNKRNIIGNVLHVNFHVHLYEYMYFLCCEVLWMGLSCNIDRIKLSEIRIF